MEAIEAISRLRTTCPMPTSATSLLCAPVRVRGRCRKRLEVLRSCLAYVFFVTFGSAASCRSSSLRTSARPWSRHTSCRRSRRWRLDVLLPTDVRSATKASNATIASRCAIVESPRLGTKYKRAFDAPSCYRRFRPGRRKGIFEIQRGLQAVTTTSTSLVRSRIGYAIAPIESSSASHPCSFVLG